jgi:hypothetical protein
MNEKSKPNKETVAEMEERERLAYEKTPQTEEELAFIDLLASTSGIWDEIDGLEYQQLIRGEWDERSELLTSKKCDPKP